MWCQPRFSSAEGMQLMMLENGSRDGEDATRQEAKEEGEWSEDAPVRAFGRASFSHSGS